MYNKKKTESTIAKLNMLKSVTDTISMSFILESDDGVFVIDGGAEAKKLGNSKVLNTVVLGLAAKHIGFSEEEWLDVLKSTVPPKTVDINTLAFKAGYEN